MPGFQHFFSFLHHFVLAKLATSSKRVKRLHCYHAAYGKYLHESDVIRILGVKGVDNIRWVYNMTSKLRSRERDQTREYLSHRWPYKYEVQ